MGISIAVGPRPASLKAMRAVTPLLWPNNTRINTKPGKKQAFDAQAFLVSASVARKVLEYGIKKTVFAQGDPATSVLYVQKGCVKITVVNEIGKEAVVAVLGPGNFFGEGCLAGQPQRRTAATTTTPSTILLIEKLELIRLLHAQAELSDQFIMHLFSRYIRIEEDLIDQLFNSSEKRLARTLLLLAHNGEQDKVGKMVPGISQEMLAEMIGTTRGRVNFFMNKFRKLGYIEYDGTLRELRINKSFPSVLEN